MSLAMTPQQNSGSFALQSRLFISMKRAGRVIDLVWFQQSAEYARAVLSTGDNMPDTEVRDIAAKLRQLLGSYLNQDQNKVAVLPIARAVPAPEPVAPAPAVTPTAEQTEDEHPEMDRHLTSLR